MFRSKQPLVRTKESRSLLLLIAAVCFACTVSSKESIAQPNTNGELAPLLERSSAQGLHTASKNAAETVEEYQQSLEASQNSGDLAAAANISLEIGDAFVLLGEFDRAIESYQQSLVVGERLDDLESKIAALGKIATLYQQIGDYNTAKANYEKMLRLLDSGAPEEVKNVYRKSEGDLLAPLDSLFSIYWVEQEYDKAVSIIGTFFQLANAFADKASLPDYRVEEIESAALAYDEAKMSELIAESIKASSGESETIRKAFSNVVFRKGRLLDAITEASQSRYQETSTEEQSKLTSLYQELAGLRLTKPRDELSSSDYEAKLNKIENEITRINLDIVERDDSFTEWLVVGGTDLISQDIQEKIPEDAALVEISEYTVPSSSERHYVAYIAKNSGEIHAIDLGNSADINSQVEAFRQALKVQSASAKSIGRQLDEQLTKPIRSLIGDKAHLLVSPDSHLNTIPFEALVDETGQYLVESYQISYLTSAKELFKFQTERRPSGYRLPFVIVADPDYDTSVNRSIQTTPTAATNRRSIDFDALTFADLPGTVREANAIESIASRSIFLTQDEPTESVIKQIRKPFILHLATHGFFLPDSAASVRSDGGRNASLELISTGDTDAELVETTPADRENSMLRSGLALAGANQQGADGEDGILTALEVAELDLHGTELVVMSACETGIGSVSSGEGVYGLRRAFAIAGAQSQIMSLWQVDDIGTSELMTLYYQNLLNKRQGRSEALRNAQLEMLNTGTYQHPYYWASFIFSGNWQPFDQPEEESTEVERYPQEPAPPIEIFDLTEEIAEYEQASEKFERLMASALALEDENRHEEALEIYEEVERFQDEFREHRLFRENRTLLENLKTLLETLYIQNRYSDAIAVAQEIIKIQESATGTADSGYFDKLTTLQALGTLYQLQGEDIKALLTYNRVFALEDSSR